MRSTGSSISARSSPRSSCRSSCGATARAWPSEFPGALMFIATVILWIGRKHYVMVPPAPPNPHSFLNVSRTALASGTRGRVLGDHGRGGGDRVVPAHPEVRFRHRGLPRAGGGDRVRRHRRLAATRGGAGQASRRRDRWRALACLRVLVLFALVTPFWSLFDQKASTWVLAGGRDDEAELVSIVANAGAQSAARDAADSVQQPRALSGAEPASATK